MCERCIDQLLFAVPQLGTWLATQAVPCLGIKPATFWLNVQGPALNPLNHTSQGHWLILVCALARN